jgi:heptosyltransferase-2
MNILILALSGIGDALMFTPALSLLRKSLPDARIDALVMFKGVNDMYERNKDIDNVYYFDFLNHGIYASFTYLLKLRNKYQVSINIYPSNRKEYNLINFLIGARKRVGVNYLRMNTRELSFLNNLRITENDSVHNVQTNIKLVEKLLDEKFTDEPGLNFPVTNDDESFAAGYLAELKIKESDVLIGFHPGSATFKNHAFRRWEPEKFAELGRKLTKNTGTKILVFGGPEEEELKQKIVKSVKSGNVFSATAMNLPQSAAVIKRCNVFVTNDSSLMHVASAMKSKVVVVIGPTNTSYIHPWHTSYKIISLGLECSPCFFYSPRPLICSRTDVKFKCIKELSVDRIYNAVESFIDK